MGAVVGVMDHPSVGSALRDGHHEGVDDEFGGTPVVDGPADDAAAVEIHHRREIQAAFLGGELGDVGDPPSIRGDRTELPADQIRAEYPGRRSGGVGAFAVAGATDPVKTGVAHQSADTLVIDRTAAASELAGDAQPAVTAE